MSENQTILHFEDPFITKVRSSKTFVLKVIFIALLFVSVSSLPIFFSHRTNHLPLWFKFSLPILIVVIITCVVIATKVVRAFTIDNAKKIIKITYYQNLKGKEVVFGFHQFNYRIGKQRTNLIGTKDGSSFLTIILFNGMHFTVN